MDEWWDLPSGGDYFADDVSAWSMPSFDFDAASMNYQVPLSPALDPFMGMGMGQMGMQEPPGGGNIFGATTPNLAPHAQQGQMGGQPGWGQQMMQPQNLLGLGGALAGLIGTVAGGGKQSTVTPQLSPQARQVGAQSNDALGQMNQFIQGQSPLQQMQMSLLQALASGQGLPPGYAQLVEQAFQPQMGDLYTQATNAGRNRGFHDQGATSPPGGAILGPGLAALQGQMAQAKLGLMQSLPQLYNTPIQSQANVAGQQAQGYSNLMGRYGVGEQRSAPLGPQIGQAIGQGMVGMGTAIGQQQQQQSLMDQLMRMQGPATGGMSYAPMYP